jgi:hypothetical protein
MLRSWRCCYYDTICHLINYLKLHKIIQDSSKGPLCRRSDVHWTPVDSRQVAGHHVIKILKSGVSNDRYVALSAVPQYHGCRG